MFAARHLPASRPVPLPVRRRSEPKSLALLVDVVLARYGILPLEPETSTQPARRESAAPRRGEQTLLFPVS